MKTHTGRVQGLCCCTSPTSASKVHVRSLHMSGLWSSSKSHICMHCRVHLNVKGWKRLACGPLSGCLTCVTHPFEFIQVICVVKYIQISCSQLIMLSLVAFSKLNLNDFYFQFIYLCMCVCTVCLLLRCECGHVSAMAYVWKSEDNLVCLTLFSTLRQGFCMPN